MRGGKNDFKRVDWFAFPDELWIPTLSIRGEILSPRLVIIWERDCSWDATNTGVVRLAGCCIFPFCV